jgi:hypothetical protein
MRLILDDPSLTSRYELCIAQPTGDPERAQAAVDSFVRTVHLADERGRGALPTVESLAQARAYVTTEA